MPAQLTHPTRSEIFTALFDLIAQASPPFGIIWQTKSQSLKHWDDVPSTAQPALFLHRGIQTATQQHAYGPTKWVWLVYLWIYYRVDAFKTISTYPDEVTDVLIDWAETILQKNEYGQQTLGGLIQHVCVEGSILFDSGITDNQAICVIPLALYV
jgi:hypothetical protein